MAKSPKPSTARKTSETPTRVYDFGVPMVPEGALTIVNDQLYRAYRFRKALIRIERSRRNRVRAIMRAMEPELNRLESRYDALEQERRKIFQEELSGVEKRDRPPEVLERLKGLRTEQRNITIELKGIRQKVYEEHFDKMERLWKEGYRREVVKGAIQLGYADPSVLDPPVPGTEEAIEQKLNEIASTKALYPGHKIIGPNNQIRQRARRYITDLLSENGGRAWQVLRRVNDVADQLSKKAKESSGLGPGTSRWVTEAAKVSFAKTIFSPKGLKPYDKTGSIGIQLTESTAEKGTKGLTVARAFSCQDPRFKLEVRPDVRLRKPHPDKQACIARIKLAGRGDKGTYVDVPVILHRAMPPDAVIKWVYLRVDRIGNIPTYRLQLTLESQEFVRKTDLENHVAINFGWRALRSGNIRVATVWDGERHQYLELDKSLREFVRHKTSLLSAADRVFNEAKLTLRGWIEQNGLQPELRQAMQAMPFWCWKVEPEELTRMSDQEFRTMLGRHLPNWRNTQKLARLSSELLKQVPNMDHQEVYRRWVQERIPAKPQGVPWSRWKKERKALDLFPSWAELSAWYDGPELERLALYLHIWVEKNDHLVNWARRSEKRIFRHRREIYRRFARNLARTFGHVVVERWDKSETAELPEAEYDTRTPQEEKASAIRQFAGVSLLAQALEHAFGRPYFHKETAVDISQVHFGCGGRADDTLPHPLTHCTRCGETYDQDVNAARHLWHKWLGDDQIPGPARSRSQGESQATAAE